MAKSLVHAVQGPADMYLGLTGAILGTIPTAILYFTAYEWCKTRLEARKAPSAVTHLASASAGAVLSSFVRVPTDTVKHRVQAYMETNVFLVGAACFAKHERKSYVPSRRFAECSFHNSAAAEHTGLLCCYVCMTADCCCALLYRVEVPGSVKADFGIVSRNICEEELKWSLCCRGQGILWMLKE